MTPASTGILILRPGLAGAMAYAAFPLGRAFRYRTCSKNCALSSRSRIS